MDSLIQKNSRNFTLHSTLSPAVNIVCIASGRGSNVGALIQAIRAKSIAARIVLVVSNISTAHVLEVARDGGLPAVHLSEKQFADHDAFARKFLEVLRAAQPDLIVLAGYLRKLPDPVCEAFRGRIINIHPALLPKYGGPGMYGRSVHEAVLANHEKESGATVHFVDEEYDHGAIIAQQQVHVLPTDTAETLADRVLEAEHELLVRAVKNIIETQSRTAEPRNLQAESQS